MNASTVLVLVERHKLEQDAATGMQLALGQNTVHISEHGSHIVPKCKLHTCCCILLQLVPFD